MKKERVYPLFFLIIILFFLVTILCCSSDTAKLKDSFADIPTIEVSQIIQDSTKETPPSVLEDTSRIKVSIGVYNSLSGGLLFLADALEVFYDGGLEVTLKLYGDYKTLIKGFKRNEVDIATIGLYESMRLALDDVDFIGVLPLIWNNISFIAYEKHYIQEMINHKIGDLEKDYNRNVRVRETSITENEVTIKYSVGESNRQEIIKIDEYVRDIKNLKNKIIGLDKDSVAYYILSNTLINEGGLVLDEVVDLPIPDIFLKTQVILGRTDIGAFSELNKISKDSGGLLIFDSTNYKTHTVESLLVQKDFAIKYRDAVSTIIKGWQTAVAFLNRNPESAINLMADSTRLSLQKSTLQKAVEINPIIPTIETNFFGDSGGPVERELRDSYFNETGNYTVEASQLLDFITKNYQEYNKIEYQVKTQNIKERLENAYYYNIIFLETAGFQQPSVSNINASSLNRNKWGMKIQIPSESSTLDIEDLYPKSIFAPQAIKINVFEEKVLTELNIKERAYVLEHYTKKLYHYVKMKRVNNEDDNRLIEIFNRIGYEDMSELNSDSYDEDKEVAQEDWNIIGKDNELFSYEY